MMRFAKALALVLALGAGVRADVITSIRDQDGSGDPVNSNGTADGQGVVFTTTGSSAGTGRWALRNFGFNLATNGSATANTIDLYLYQVGGGGSLSLKTSQTGMALTGLGGQALTADPGRAFAVDLTGFYGSTSDQNSGLLANTQYLLAWNINFSATPTGDSWLMKTNDFTGSTWNPVASYSSFTPSSLGTLNNLSQGLDIGTTQWGYSLDAVAVPEPGTLLLGGIAAVGGAGGWWARRRKKAVPADATPEGEQAATV
jgi:hypothetical protein